MIVGLANGCFDGLHSGHKRFLREAVRRCGHLIVAVNHDAWCRMHKGPQRPLVMLEFRIEALECFLHFLPGKPNYSVVPFNGDAYRLAEIIAPDVVFRGHDQRDESPIPVVRIDKFGDFSTTSQARSAS